MLPRADAAKPGVLFFSPSYVYSSLLSPSDRGKRFSETYLLVLSVCCGFPEIRCHLFKIEKPENFPFAQTFIASISVKVRTSFYGISDTEMLIDSVGHCPVISI